MQTIKALDDWTLEVLGVPFGGPHNGKDTDGEFFSPSTNLHPDKFPLPPVVYYHGFEPDGSPSGAPEYIGKAVERIERPDGVWYRVILDKTKEYARRVWEAAKEGLARASSGTVSHLRRVASDGHILEWPVAELSVFDADGRRQPTNAYAVALPVMKATYKTAGIEWPEPDEPEAEDREDESPVQAEREIEGLFDPAEKELKTTRKAIMSDKTFTAAEVEAAKAAGRAELEAELKAEQERQAEIERAKAEAVEAAKAEWKAEQEKAEKENVKARRLPEGDAPYVAQFAELRKYDNLSPEDQAVMVGVLNANDGVAGIQHKRASEHALKALAIKLEEAKKSNATPTQRLGVVAGNAMKAVGIKADEIQQQDLTGFGDEWVGVAYSQALWEAIRAGTFVAANLPSIEVPPGHESITIPLEGADPTFYKVAEATDTASSGWPNTTITSSQMATSSKSLTLAKMGARVLWSGELAEDSLIPFASQLRSQLERAGAEQLEHAIIDGDTASGASANINDIAGTPASTDLFLMFNGFRKSPLVTTTANSRSGGALTAEDFLETVKLMGTAGLNAADVTRVAFIVDPNVYWKALELEEVKTRDVFVAPTIENGQLNGIYGYRLYRSFFMHYKSTARKANTAGKVDVDTTSNNTTGSILAVRWDQWLLGFRRRMTMETTRIARADTTEIVALSRLGLAQRDTEASAITYGVTVA